MTRKEDVKVGNTTKITLLLDHYNKGKQDVDIRRTRHNGWNQTIDVYMSKLPSGSKWPYTARVTDPRLRTTILEKTGRLINAKLQGRLVPRKNANVIGARINNMILEYQWDSANFGGSMIEKIAMSDQITRLYGATFALTFWDKEKQSNDIKILNPNDVFIDFAANHIKNARWVVVREFTTIEQLKKRGFNLDDVELGELPSDQRSNEYQDKVKLNKNLEDRTGQDLSNPTLIVATEYTADKEVVYLPKQAKILRERPNPNKHGKIPIAQLRYYPLGDDVYGESEAEPVLPLARAINSYLSGFIDEMNLALRPPIKVMTTGVKKETIEYGPGAQWLMNNLQGTEQVKIGAGSIQAFNSTYPVLVAAFNTAMGDQSLGVSNVTSRSEDKTATEVRDLQQQQFSRDQYNQQFLGEYLKDIMMFWLSNNQQFLMDDDELVMKIVGKDNIRDFQSLKLDAMDVTNEDIEEVGNIILQNPEATTDENVAQVLEETSQPKFPTKNGQAKMIVDENGEEAELTIEKGDMEGLFDYIPDIKSMAQGSGSEQKEGRLKSFEIMTNPAVQQQLQLEGEKVVMKDLLVTILEDNGTKDAERLFEPIEQASPLEGGGSALGVEGQPSIPGVPAPLPNQPGAGGLPPTQGF